MKFAIKLAAYLLAYTLALHAHAQQIKHIGDWAVNFSIADMRIASTTNSAGATAGVACFVKRSECQAYIAPNFTCAQNAMVPMMINSAVGAYPLITRCEHIDELHLLVIDEFDSAIEAFQSGGEIGFALPMQSGEFRVLRFSTIGATLAVKEVRTLPPPAPKKARDTLETL
jgi:hypothetical protein